MALLIAVAFTAGILAVLGPCIAPVLPLVMGAAATGGRRRSVGILLGFGLSFIAVTVVLASALAAAGLTTDPLRLASVVLLGIVGLTVAWPAVGSRIGALFSPLRDVGLGLAVRRPGDGIAGGLVLGAAIGLVWAPCVGPIMAGVIAAAAVHGPSVETLLIASAFAAGFAVPLALVATLGRRAALSSARLGAGGWTRRTIGMAMVVSALVVVAGQDVAVENGLASLLPADAGGALAGVEGQSAVQRELDALRLGTSGSIATSAPSAATSGSASAPSPGASAGAGGLPTPVATSLPESVSLEDLGPAPDFTGIQAWIGSGPVAMASLRGKVVLVEFWTFACINCVHVQPYVTAWHDRYASSGLVVIGVHTPELSFERDLGNVRDAVAKAGIDYPVAVDPGFATWNAFGNGAWPAMYFIDRTGRIRYAHGGEGAYDTAERVIRELLSPGS